jgi:hypothetical protein
MLLCISGNDVGRLVSSSLDTVTAPCYELTFTVLVQPIPGFNEGKPARTFCH